MSERIDILMPPVDCLPYFTVDTAVLYTPILYFAPLPVDYLTAGDGSCVFTKGDNFIIKTCGLVMPLSFQIDRIKSNITWPYIRFSMYAYGQTTGKQYRLSEISGSGVSPFFLISMESYDTPADVFIDIQNQAPVTGSYLKNEDFTLSLSQSLYFTNVSMVGVPAALDTTIQFVTPYVKVLHTFPLTPPTP